MPGSSDLLGRVRSALGDVPGVTEQRMFGSMAFLVNGHLSVSCRPDRLMCRIDPAFHDQALSQEGCTTVVMRGRIYRGYVYVASSAVEDEQRLRYWLDLALAHVAALPAKPA